MAFPRSARAASVALVPPGSSGIIAAGSDVVFLEAVDSVAVFALSSATFSTVFWSFPPLTDTAKNALHVSRALKVIQRG